MLLMRWLGIDDRPRDLLIRTLREGDDHVRLSVQDTGIGDRSSRS